MENTNRILESLILQCNRSGIFPRDSNIEPDDDLFEHSTLDSMAMTMLIHIVEENYNVIIASDHLIAELRTLRLISKYISDNVKQRTDDLDYQPVLY